MRAATRLFAAVKPGQFLETGAPTGLTGLVTHPSPRSTLVYLYTSTLDKLQEIPETSVYRQSTEALTKHRLKIIEAVKPKGFDQWQQRIQMQLENDKDAFDVVETSQGLRVRHPGKPALDTRAKKSEWNGEVGEAIKEGAAQANKRVAQSRKLNKLNGNKKFNPERSMREIKLDPEPPLTAEQYVSPCGLGE